MTLSLPIPKPSLSLLAVLAAALPGLTSCRFHNSYYSGSSSTLLLARSTDEEGRTTEYVIVPGSGDEPAIHRVGTQALDVAFLGITAASIDREAAKDLGLDAWNGVLLRRVATSSAAREAGLRNGDVLLSIGGEALTSAQQCTDLIQTQLVPGETVDVTFLRDRDEEGWTETVAELVVGKKEINETATDRFALKSSEMVELHTGLELANVPEALAREIWGSNGAVVIVSDVVSGSPAYHEGLRKSDRILTCNGVQVGDVLEIERTIQRGAPSLRLDVDGPLGRHSAQVETDADIDARYETHIPILYDRTSSVDRASTSVLDFIFQFGFTKRHRYLESGDRDTKRRSSLSIFPLGMFEFVRTPTTSRNTIFWLISWSTRR